MRKRTKKNPPIHAKAKSPATLVFAASEAVTIAAADMDEAGKEKGPPKFEAIAYTGGPMRIGGYDDPIVMDLSGMKFGNSLVANLDHDVSKRVGNVTAADNDGKRLVLSGTASAATKAKKEVVQSARGGFTWQASIEASPGKIEKLAEKKTCMVNGQMVAGPCNIVRSSTLKGFAFVSHGADDNTSCKIAAGKLADPPTSRDDTMNPELKAWIETMGFDVEQLSEDQIAGLTANYEGRQAKPKKKEKLTDVIAREKAERERVEKITDIAAEAIAEEPSQLEKIQEFAEHAIEAKWDGERFELELLRFCRPKYRPNFPNRREPKTDNRVIEAALCRSGNLNNVEKYFDAATLEAADKSFRSGLGLQDVLMIAARANGYQGYSVKADLEGVLRAAFPQDIRAEGLSTLSLPNILSNIANKFLIEGWMAIDRAWREITAIRSVNDFKTATSLSLTGGMMFDKLGPAGEIKHGTTGEIKYTNKADTYARMFAISRSDIVNDDLGALTAVPRRLGRGAALKLNDLFWSVFLNNSSFFTSGNNNVSTGGGSALGLTGLTNAESTFLLQTDPDGFPLGIDPAILLVPTALKATGATLMTSELVVSGNTSAASGLPNKNIFQGRFKLVSTPYLSNSAYTGNSAAAWYLLAKPEDLPVIEVALLNGREAPVVETAQADFSILGIQMRGYHDFGVSLQEYRGGVRSAGS